MLDRFKTGHESLDRFFDASETLLMVLARNLAISDILIERELISQDELESRTRDRFKELEDEMVEKIQRLHES